MNDIKATHRMSHFLKRNIRKYKFKEKCVLKLPKFWMLKMLFTFLHIKVLKYGEQDVVLVNLVWVILEVTLVYIVHEYESIFLKLFV